MPTPATHTTTVDGVGQVPTRTLLQQEQELLFKVVQFYGPLPPAYDGGGKLYEQAHKRLGQINEELAPLWCARCTNYGDHITAWCPTHGQAPLHTAGDDCPRCGEHAALIAAEDVAADLLKLYCPACDQHTGQYEKAGAA